jgi:hypothetical protein
VPPSFLCMGSQLAVAGCMKACCVQQEALTWMGLGQGPPDLLRTSHEP